MNTVYMLCLSILSVLIFVSLTTLSLNKRGLLDWVTAPLYFGMILFLLSTFGLAIVEFHSILIR